MITATYIDHMGTDLTVVNAARVSFGKKSVWDTEPRSREVRDGKTYYKDFPPPNTLLKGDTKLIKYLANHSHYSPFGHCFASFHVKAPVFVARQLVKHKFLRWNEISRRYVSDKPEFYEPKEWRGKSADKKQGSEGVVDVGDWGDTNWACLKAYNDLLEHGVAPEQARMVLPQSTMTEWYWSGSLDAFADMCKLRCATDTQAETQEVAWDIYFQMEKLFPVSWIALIEDAY